MVEDIDAASPTRKRVTRSNEEDDDDALGSTELKASNATNGYPFRINGDSGLQGTEDRYVDTAVTKGVTNEEGFEATEFTSTYYVSNWEDLGEEKDGHVVTDANAIDCRHPQFAVFDKECDPNTVKDIWVDEGVPTQNGNCPKNGGSLNHEKYQARDFDESAVSELKSFKRTARRASTNQSLDFESLLDQVEAGNTGAQGTSNGFDNTSFLNELMVSENNPFLEDSPFEVSQKDERFMDVHPSNPFDTGVKLNEAELISEEMERISKNFTEESNSSKVLISANNPFLENSSFKAIKEDDKEASKFSEKDATVEGTYHNEVAADGTQNKLLNDCKVENTSVTSNVGSATHEACDGIKIPEESDNSANPAQLQHDPMESSFAAVNPSPALISYSGQIPFSGSISHRSESSATSNRSFAFPVLQTEWNTSPVKMAKAKAKHHSWRHTLLCCNF